MSEENTPEVESTDFTEMSKGEKVTFGVVAAGMIGLMGAVVWAGIKYDQDQAEEYRLREEERIRNYRERVDWMNDESEKGNVVYQLHQGGYLVVPRDVDQKIVLK